MTAAIQSNSTVSTATHNGSPSFTFDQTGIVSGFDGGVRSLTASIAANAITVTLNPITLDFRSTTLTTGTIVQLQTTSTLTLTIAATDSFGLVTAAGNQRIAILAINNAGTIELAASSLAGGVNLDETGLISTVTAATTGTQIKAANARTNVAYRVVGFLDATFTTATGWGSLTLVQGQGGQALAAMSSLGYGQTWQGVTGSRALSTNYYNTTGKPIYVFVYCVASSSGNSLTLTINGISTAIINAYSASAGIGVNGIVPPGGVYSASLTAGSLSTWAELR